MLLTCHTDLQQLHATKHGFFLLCKDMRMLLGLIVKVADWSGGVQTSWVYTGRCQ